MPCSDSSSSLVIKLNHEERFAGFEFAKITCGREINGKTGLSTYFVGKTLSEVIATPFADVVRDLDLKDEESQFIFYLEWDALRSAIAQYLGYEDDSIDKDRCQITSIESTPEGTEIAQVILPPKELPKILPCSLANNN